MKQMDKSTTRTGWGYLCSKVEDLARLALDEFLQGLRGQFRALGGSVELGDVASMMLAVVEVDGLGGDVRLEGIAGEGEIRKLESHGEVFRWQGTCYKLHISSVA